MPFIDLHCDTVSRLLATQRAGQPGSLRQADFHIDLEKLKGSDYILQNFAPSFLYAACIFLQLEDYSVSRIYNASLICTAALLSPS